MVSLGSNSQTKETKFFFDINVNQCATRKFKLRIVVKCIQGTRNMLQEHFSMFGIFRHFLFPNSSKIVPTWLKILPIISPDASKHHIKDKHFWISRNATHHEVKISTKIVISYWNHLCLSKMTSIQKATLVSEFDFPASI